MAHEVRHKLAYHLQKSGDVWRHAIDNRFAPFLKVMDFALDGTFLNNFKSANPEMPVYARLYKEQQPLSLDLHVARTQGINFANECLSLPQQILNHIAAFETYNEPNNNPGGFADTDPQQEEKMLALDAFMAAQARVLIAHDIGTIPFNFSTHFPLEKYIHLFPETIKTCTKIGVHGYGWPTHLEPDAEGGILRYRKIRQAIIDYYGYTHHQFVLTEAGLTQGVIKGNDVGWQTGQLSYLEMFNDLLLLNQELAKDPYMLGAALYTVGASSWRWVTFELWDKITALISYHDWPSISKPPPDPDPEPSPSDYIAGQVDELYKVRSFIDQEIAKLQG